MSEFVIVPIRLRAFPPAAGSKELIVNIHPEFLSILIVAKQHYQMSFEQLAHCTTVECFGGLKLDAVTDIASLLKRAYNTAENDSRKSP